MKKYILAVCGSLVMFVLLPAQLSGGELPVIVGKD
jgi:hypothetical protein